MGLPSQPNPQDGLLPMLVVSVALVVALLRNTARSILSPAASSSGGQQTGETSGSSRQDAADGRRRVSVVQFRSLRNDRKSDGGAAIVGGWTCGGSGRKEAERCCVCLCGFEEEVSELRCSHYFHKACLQEWFNNLCITKLTCPLCRSLL